MYVYDSACQQLEIGAALFEGGEGVICAVNSLPGRLAKLYRFEKRAGKETKLTWMTANPPADPGKVRGHAAIAWPETLLYENGRRFVGYLMPEIKDAKTLLHVTNPRLRSQVLPDFDQHYLHRTARNLAAALNALHRYDYVIGDLNETNVLVASTALVTVIDTDSFQVKEKHAGQITFYPCPVGRPEYTPPELQGSYFQNEVRQPEQDTFALAVLIFQLLMEGSHPFRSTWVGNGDPPPVEQKIIQGWFPYVPKPTGPVKPPPGISLDRLHPPLAGLMRRCFVDGHDHPRRRPSAAEWESALEEAENALCTCTCGVVYTTHLKACPRCGAQFTPSRPQAPPTITPVSQSAHPPTISQAPGANPVPQPAPPSADVACPECGTLNPVQRAYCQKCASHLYPLGACPHCGQLTAQGIQAKFCEVCGRRL